MPLHDSARRRCSGELLAQMHCRSSRRCAERAASCLMPLLQGMLH